MRFCVGLDESKAVLLSDKWKQNFTALSFSMIDKTLTVNELVDMEWKFGGMLGVPSPPPWDHRLG